MSFEGEALGVWLGGFGRLLEPMTLAEQIQRTPILILGVLESCLAIAYGSLWRVVPDFRVFRIPGFFYASLGLEQCWQYSGGSNSV